MRREYVAAPFQYEDVRLEPKTNSFMAVLPARPARPAVAPGDRYNLSAKKRKDNIRGPSPRHRPAVTREIFARTTDCRGRETSVPARSPKPLATSACLASAESRFCHLFRSELNLPAPRECGGAHR